MIENKILGAAAGIQRQDVIDNSETTVLPSLNQAVIMGRFKRGRMDKPFGVTADNYQALLGHDPSNKSYTAVEDAFKRGISQVNVLRVGGVLGKSKPSDGGGTIPEEPWPPAVVTPVKLLAETFDSPLSVTINFDGGMAEVDFGDGSEVLSYTDSVEHTFNDLLSVFEVSVTPLSRIDTLTTDIQELADWGTAGSISRFRFLHPVPAVPNFIPDWLVDLSDMFNGCQGFNQDISVWDVGHVINMARMLRDCRNFLADINVWNVSNVRDMSGMLSMVGYMTSDLSSWNVSNVEDMSYMFYDSSMFSDVLNIKDWNVSKVRNMAYMFGDLYDFNCDLSSWNVGAVENMEGMFKNGYNLFHLDYGDGYWSLNSWNVSKVRNMAYMFYSCYEGIASDISRWDVSNVEDMSFMFYDCYKMGQLTFWNTSKVRSMEGMFWGCYQFSSDISNWDVSNVRNMDNMLKSCSVFIASLQYWCVQHILTEPIDMFNRVDYLPDENKPVWGTCPRGEEVPV